MRVIRKDRTKPGEGNRRGSSIKEACVSPPGSITLTALPENQLRIRGKGGKKELARVELEEGNGRRPGEERRTGNRSRVSVQYFWKSKVSPDSANISTAGREIGDHKKKGRGRRRKPTASSSRRNQKKRPKSKRPGRKGRREVQVPQNHRLEQHSLGTVIG